ncbi:ARM repeat-containing protein [Mycena galopus ATCC 62051]|nr:ARM repeat-containing protein [Mycena galopus ATCC 62051]
MQQKFATPCSPILAEFRATPGSIVEFSGDQLGSRFIQDTLPEASNEEKESVFDEIYPNHTITLIQNVFGNYVIQKLFQDGTQTQKTALVNSMEGSVVYLSCNLYGCWVIQMAIQSILPEQQASFVRELEPHIMSCVKDSNGSHVIQKVIERVSPDRQAFISSFLGHTFDLATHPSGCRVLQQCLKYLPEVQIRPLLDELLSDGVETLMQDQFGNYVIQCILETGRPEDKASVIAQLRGRMLFMAQHKSASNVCEKALAHADPEARHALIEEIMGPPSKPDAMLIAVMIQDAYGNYVLQRALGVAEGDQQEALVDVVRQQLLNMRSSTYSTAYSKRLTSLECELNKLSPSEPL